MPQSPNIPETTVLKARSGDQHACAQLYEEYNKAMYNICIRMTGNKEDAADVLQDAFLQAFKSLPQLKQPEAFAGWLKRIVINACIRFSKTSLSWYLLDENENDTASEEEEEWWTKISLGLVHEEIKRLPSGCRQVFVLYAMEGFGHKEIAAQLQVSESTSKSQYQRARALLKDRILKAVQQNG